MTTAQTTKPLDHTEWCRRYGELQEIAKRIDKARTRRAWALAATVGIHRCGCSLHNASIATIGNGWGAGNSTEPDGRRVIRVARAATRLMNSAFEGYRIVERWDGRVRGFCLPDPLDAALDACDGDINLLDEKAGES